VKFLRRGFGGPRIINLTSAKLVRILTIRDSISIAYQVSTSKPVVMSGRRQRNGQTDGYLGR
jgi:hypothetical protein